MNNNSAYCFVSIAPVRSNPQDSSEMVTQLLFGEVVDILEITEKWLKIKTFYDNYEGWIDPKHVKTLSKKEVTRWLDGIDFLHDKITTVDTPWGEQQIVRGSFVPFSSEQEFNIGNDVFRLTTPRSTVSNPSLITIAKDYLNSPYLWGGKSPFGIDCSGFTQVCFRLMGINLPRDASQQVEHGSSVNFEERMAGDVLFFHNEAGKIIHVGICLSENEIIHASGRVRVDFYDQKGIIHFTNECYTHHLHSIKRFL